jgi:hypothetical protein
VGGNTGFRDVRTALQKLDKRLQAKLETAYVDIQARAIPDFKNAAADEIPPDARHRVVFNHPIINTKELYALSPREGFNMTLEDGT